MWMNLMNLPGFKIKKDEKIKSFDAEIPETNMRTPEDGLVTKKDSWRWGDPKKFLYNFCCRKILPKEIAVIFVWHWSHLGLRYSEFIQIDSIHLRPRKKRAKKRKRDTPLKTNGETTWKSSIRKTYIASIYGILTCIYHKFRPNVGK